MKIMKQSIFHGYRGTTKLWGEKCEKSFEFAVSCKDNEYFGHGIYFFENDYKEALNWVKFSRKVEDGNIAIIYANINVNPEKIFDLIDTETYNYYIKMIEELDKRLLLDVEKLEITKPYDTYLINHICKSCGYKMIRAFHTPNMRKATELKKYEKTRTQKSHIQLCVRNKDIITTATVKYI
jgi:hypothetical protein